MDMELAPKSMITHVVFSDKPLVAAESMTALAGETDSDTDLNQLLLLMYQAWTAEAFQEGRQAAESRVVIAH